jgi:hypothetical protein
MVRKSVLFLTGIGMLFLLIPTVAADGYWYPMVLNGSINQPLFSLQYYHTVKTTEHSQEKIEFNWTSGIVAINYYVFTRENFDNWSVGLPCSADVSSENITSGWDSFRTYVVNQTWVFVWFNPSLTSTQLVGRYERYRWVEVDGFIPGFPWDAILIGALSAVVLVLIMRKKNRRN